MKWLPGVPNVQVTPDLYKKKLQLNFLFNSSIVSADWYVLLFYLTLLIFVCSFVCYALAYLPPSLVLAVIASLEYCVLFPKLFARATTLTS